MALDTAIIRAIDRSRKADLIAEVERWGHENGRRWIIGGARTWSKDELVSAVVRIREGGQP